MKFLQVSAAVWNPARETGWWEIYVMRWDLGWISKDKEKPCRWKRCMFVWLEGYWRTKKKTNNIDYWVLKLSNLKLSLRLVESELQEDKRQLQAGMLVVTRSPQTYVQKSVQTAYGLIDTSLILSVYFCIKLDVLMMNLTKFRLHSVYSAKDSRLK